MNPALLQHPSSFDFRLPSTSKYNTQDRDFSNSTHFSAAEYSYSNRRPQTSLANGEPASALTLPTNSSHGYNAHSSLNENSYQTNSHQLLSPPDSTNGAATVGGQSTSTSCLYSSLPKLPNNASTTQNISSLPTSAYSSNWNEPTMMTLERPRLSAFPQTLSPPFTYTPASGLSNSLLGQRSYTMDRYPNSYQNHGHSISPSYFPGAGLKLSAGLSSLQRPNSYLPFPQSEQSLYGMAQSMTQPEVANTNRLDGPPFNKTLVIQPIYINTRQEVAPDISASIQKGFFQVDNKWTCYRRNYFTVSCSFHFQNTIFDGPYYLQHHGQLEPIRHFGVSISAKTAVLNNQESELRGLVQHTPKRDKATESVPGRHLILPAAPPSPGSNFGMTTGNHLYPGSQHISQNMMGGIGSFDSPSQHSIPTSYTFERIQFQKATANNGKRRAQQQYFHIVVELSANIARKPNEDNWILIATKESDQMVVRGRSPGHYKDNGRRDSQSNMDPDRSTGPGSDGTSSSSNMPFSGHGSSAMDWTPGHRGGHIYTGSTYRSSQMLECSPTSLGSSTTLTGSPADLEFTLSDSHFGKPLNRYSNHQMMPAELSDSEDEIAFPTERPTWSRKRVLEGDSYEGDSASHHRLPVNSYTDNSGIDFAPPSNATALCAFS